MSNETTRRINSLCTGIIMVVAIVTGEYVAAGLFALASAHWMSGE